METKCGAAGVRMHVSLDTADLGAAVASPRPDGRLSNLGVRLPDRPALEVVRARLTAAGLALREEPEVTCCYARQDKVWVEDPEGNAWEFYLLLDEVDAPSAASSDASCCVPTR
jgi:hypothetical protein